MEIGKANIMAKARILLADDHELFGDGLASLINAQPDLEVVGRAGDGLEALTLARDLKPDLILMDVSMPVCNGLEATRLIRTTLSDSAAQILILTVHEEDDKLFEAIKAGANGYLLKNTDAPRFLQSVRAVLAGEAVLPPKMATHLLTEFARLANRPAPAAREQPDLTLREREVLELIATNASDKEIAGQLSVSVYTVKTHVRNILSKLHAANRRQAARIAARQGLVNNVSDKN